MVCRNITWGLKSVKIECCDFSWSTVCMYSQNVIWSHDATVKTVNSGEIIHKCGSFLIICDLKYLFHSHFLQYINQFYILFLTRGYLNYVLNYCNGLKEGWDIIFRGGQTRYCLQQQLVKEPGIKILMCVHPWDLVVFPAVHRQMNFRQPSSIWVRHLLTTRQSFKPLHYLKDTEYFSSILNCTIKDK